MAATTALIATGRMGEGRAKGFFVSFAYTGNVMTEIGAFFRQTGKPIVALMVKDIREDAGCA